ncbi:MAG TPA: penicillin-binding protein activator [Casimicrobiaceae bacterium]|nr:penicillin-binding protein activator [Casimicrobiaceae bacterium]
MNVRCCARGAARLARLLGPLLLGAAALSSAQWPPASAQTIPSEAPRAPSTAAPQSPGPSTDAPATPPSATGAASQAEVVADAKAPDIALVLPLDTPAYARAADAVRAGFLAAASTAGMSDRCIVIGHNLDGVIGAFQIADQRGAHVVVGPLVRDDLKTLAISGLPLRPTIALNQFDDGTPLPPNVYSLALAVESDARVIARRALADGAKTVDVVSSDNPLMRRFAVSFAAEWIQAGGKAPSDYRFDGAMDGLIALRKLLAKSAPDAVLLALDGSQTALAKPFVGQVTAYASGLLFDRTPEAGVRDLDDVRVVEIPWIVTPDAAEFAKLPRRDFGSAALTRLYALGLDAFRVAARFVTESPAEMEFDGATGHLALNAQRQFVREGRLAVYRDGQLVPLEPR